MKKIIFLLITGCSLLVSCGDKKPKDLIAKKWQVTDLSKGTEQMPDSQKTKMKETVLEFTKDGKMSITGWVRDKSGTYTLSEDGKTLTVVTGGRSEDSEVSELTSSKLVLLDKRSGNKLTAVPK